MRQYNRLCNEFRSGLHAKYCDECPVSSIVNGKDATCAEVMRSDPEWFEKTVMDWAAKNPELRYPTWVEWWKANFPDAAHVFCPKMLLPYTKSGCGTYSSCGHCIAQPIPADIAEKLRIKPIGGEER